MPAISALKRQRTENWELQVEELSENIFSSFLLFICFTFDATVLSSFLSDYCGYCFFKSLILKSSLRIFLLTLSLGLLGMVTVSQCVLVTCTSEPVATMYEYISIYVDQASVQISNAHRGALRPPGWMPNNKTIQRRDDSFNTFFNKIGKHGSKAMFIYLEPTVIDKIFTGT